MMNITFSVLGGLGLFLYGMKIMSEGLQSATGEGLKNILWKATNNRFKGLITGFGITAVIQSSSATTVMLVSFVSAGLINLTQATGIVFGANIGTSVTGWIVAIIGFKFKINALSLPAIAFGFFIRFIDNDKMRNWGDFLLGFGILFLGLGIMSDSVKDLRGSEVITTFMATYKASGLLSTLIVIFIGAAVTMIIQSSSATMAMTMTLAFSGFIDFYTAAALILGENIGTTITANIAAVGSPIDARRTARVHFLFNFIGVLWILIVFKSFFIPVIDWLVPGDPFSPDINIRSAAIATHMAAFHTGFNLINAVIFLPFVKQLAMIATWLVPDDKKKTESHLMYITTNIVAIPSINLNQARLEIERMKNLVNTMYSLVVEVIKNPDKKLGKEIEKIQTLENQIDLLERDISTFLVKVSRDHLSKDQSNELNAMLHKIGDLESIGDECESIMKLIRRKYDFKLEFSEEATKEIIEAADKVQEFLNLISPHIISNNTDIMLQAEVIENRVDELKRELRNQHIKRLNANYCNVDQGIIFIDMVSCFEKIGDHAYSIAETISGKTKF
ncbi:MAG: Na/Pi cotransporter [Spirochaetae bacterium HGW-Spirochaetae-5]|nr:MAG: Na/Pi cotransporter [Spirochaetae bacterium HGW-Spirochaetae-5]